MKKFNILYSCALFIFVCFSVQAQQTNAQESYSQQNLQQAFSDAELAQVLAPIALYPDSLLTHILIASTYPLEIVEAHRWLKKNDSLNVKQVAEAIEDFDWDASVKALVPFEQILSRLSDDLSWMQQLGNAFLQDESRVLASIQTLRYEAKHAGNLNKMANMEVSYDDENIIIEPIQREVVFVPYYDTRMVYGNWRWSSYPPVYWAPHHRVYVNHHNPFYWHSGVRISFNYFFSTFHWHNRHVVVINPRRTHRYRARKLITHGGYAKPWLHKPVHRRGVSYKNKVVRERYHGEKSHGGFVIKKSTEKNRNMKSNNHAKIYNTARFSKAASNHAKKLKTAKVAPHKPREHLVVKSNRPSRKNQYQADSLRVKSFNRPKEKHTKERYSKVRH